MRLLATLSSIGLLFVVLLAMGILYAYSTYMRPGPLFQETFFTVEKGQGVGTIAQNLEKEGIISSATYFRLAARVSGKDSDLKAGEYLIPPSVSVERLLDIMNQGHVYARHFTVPEGKTSWEVVQILNSVPELTGAVAQIPPEGSLLPETYLFQRGDDRQEKLDRMQIEMQSALQQIKDDMLGETIGMSDQEIITLASIIEKETGKPEERRRVSGVFHNRLKAGMPLQTDPTVIYAITKGKMDQGGLGPLGRRLLRKDLEIDSPYNTYKYPGLPPGPIANPGKASIRAAIDPENHNYLYFVADGTGGHLFAKTLEEHNRNVANWRKIRREMEEEAKRAASPPKYQP